MNIAIFASGAGSNAQKIIDYFRGHPYIKVSLVVSNRKQAGVLAIAEANQIPTLLINRASFYESEEIIDTLRNCNIELVVLAGFLWLVPPYLIQHYHQKIVNIHPSILPNYGGKGCMEMPFIKLFTTQEKKLRVLPFTM